MKKNTFPDVKVNFSDENVEELSLDSFLVHSMPEIGFRIDIKFRIKALLN